MSKNKTDQREKIIPISATVKTGFLVQVALVEGLYQVFKATLDVYCDGK